MKERIYSIPLTDALNSECECVMCAVTKKLESDAVDYFLGPSMMEPDNRIVTNNRGFCPQHLEMLYERGNRLGLALMLDTYLEELRGKLARKMKGAPSVMGANAMKKASLRIAADIDKLTCTCALCDKFLRQEAAAAGNFVYLWSKERDFRLKFENSKGLCLPHTKLILEQAPQEIGGRELDEFVREICAQTQKQLAALNEDIHWFTQKYDYKNQDAPWGTAKDSLVRALTRLGGK
ncbi:MAG: DUF6062 family protein [Clostridia bacterium]|nr:DUF6062 family protein [Clostridia bacterium]